MKHHLFIKTLALSFVFFALAGTASAKKKEDTEKKDKLSASTFNSYKWRSIGPAFASGRISDFAVNPNDFSEYYVAVASGHI